MEELFEVKDKCIVITGGAGVLCGCMGTELASRGAKICILDCDESRAKELCKNIEADGGFAFGVEADVLDKESVQVAFDRAIKSMGRVDVLINGAGGNKKEATSVAGFRKTYRRKRKWRDFEYFKHERLSSLDEDSRLFSSKGRGQQFHPVACRAHVSKLFKGHSRQCNCAGILPDRTKSISTFR
jgi:NAD(P)-dependent dehydrogenase (short-subunit alcohol dehydrogenase family)